MKSDDSRSGLIKSRATFRWSLSASTKRPLFSGPGPTFRRTRPKSTGLTGPRFFNWTFVTYLIVDVESSVRK